MTFHPLVAVGGLDVLESRVAEAQGETQVEPLVVHIMDVGSYVAQGVRTFRWGREEGVWL